MEVTLLKIDGELVPLEMATKEEQIQYQAGEIESVIQTRYGMKAVFDVAQTVCPIEMYQHFHRQYHETEREQLVKGMTEILEGMEYQIRYQNLFDLGKDWIFTESGNVVLHENLHPEEKLSALAEIYSKAVMGMEESRKISGSASVSDRRTQTHDRGSSGDQKRQDRDRRNLWTVEAERTKDPFTTNISGTLPDGKKGTAALRTDHGALHRISGDPADRTWLQ